MKNTKWFFKLQSWALLIFLADNSFAAMEMSHEDTHQMSLEKHSVMHKASHHPPIAIMGSGFHKKGEFMFSFRFMNMQMQNNN